MSRTRRKGPNNTAKRAATTGLHDDPRKLDWYKSIDDKKTLSECHSDTSLMTGATLVLSVSLILIGDVFEDHRAIVCILMLYLGWAFLCASLFLMLLSQNNASKGFDLEMAYLREHGGKPYEQLKRGYKGNGPQGLVKPLTQASHWGFAIGTAVIFLFTYINLTIERSYHEKQNKQPDQYWIFQGTNPSIQNSTWKKDGQQRNTADRATREIKQKISEVTPLTTQ